MKLRHLQIERFNRLVYCEIKFEQPHLLNGFIGEAIGRSSYSQRDLGWRCYSMKIILVAVK